MHHRPRVDDTAGARTMAPEPRWENRLSGVIRPVLFTSLAACGLLQAVLISMWAPWIKGALLIGALYVLVTATAILVLARAGQATPGPRWTVPLLLLGGFAVTVVLALAALHAFPNSADEYGYNYLAGTLLRGRLWNEPLPDELQDVFKTGYIADRDGKRASQYLPGWPVVLAGFTWARVPALANPALGLLAAALLWLSLRRLPATPGARLAALVLGAAAPFALFTNATFFNHTLTAAALLAVVWLDLRDAEAPSAWNRAGIGFAFSVLLVTRYEAFLIAFALFVCDGVLRKRARFIPWAMPAAAGGLPLAAALLWYNWSITGNPLQTMMSWGTPTITYGLYSTGMDGQHSPTRGLLYTLSWGLGWHNFASVLTVPLFAVALRRRVSAGTVRWFDLMLPALIVFFLFFPDDGGFQHGPRYWYLGHVALPLTIVAGLTDRDGLWRLGRWSLDPLRLATAQLYAFAGFTLGYAIFLREQTELRLVPSRVAATAPAQSVVLIRWMEYPHVRSWQKKPVHFAAWDFTRNGLDGFGPVIVGIDLGERRTAALCRQMPDRQIFRLVFQGIPPVGHLEPVCNQTDPGRTGNGPA